jgi:hypothetical protein
MVLLLLSGGVAAQPAGEDSETTTEVKVNNQVLQKGHHIAVEKGNVGIDFKGKGIHTVTQLSVGDTVEVKPTDRAWQDSQRVTIEETRYGEVVSEAVIFHGSVWYEIRIDGESHWISQYALEPYSGDPPTDDVSTGDTVVVTESTTAWQDGEQVTVEAGVTGTVVGGPQAFDGKSWYQIETSSGKYWIAEGALALA